MKRERNQQIDAVFQAALEREAGERAAFLEEACADDPALRREVEALLSSDERAQAFIEAPALEIVSKLGTDDWTISVVGKNIGPYRIEAELGSGGTGDVYLAHDSRLGRKVAVKLLDPSLLGDSKSRLRFLREARLASALDHPNICTIHEVGEAAGHLFIAMQYVEGQTLKRVIDGRPLGLDSLLSICLQVADALATAHSRGIIHRDIKTGNIIITPQGQAKVLDFGLAKLLASEEGRDIDLTKTGMVMGTPSSMSPEQVRGERADHRSDIFSFGVVIYEMATGRMPFKGKTRTEVMNAVIRQPHTPVADLNKDVPAQLSAVLDRALAKEPLARYQSMQTMIADLRQAIAAAGGFDHLFSSADIPGGVIPYVRPRQRTLLGVFGRPIERPFALASLAAGVAVAIFSLIAAYLWLKPSQPSPPPQQRLISTFPGSHRAPSFSPDGQKIAFINAGDGVPQVWVKDLTQGEPVQFTSGDVPADRPRWSPSGDQIVYARRSQGTESIWSVSAQGGASRKLIEGGRNPNWSWDGRRLVFERSYDVWTANADGGDQSKVEGVPPTDLLLADRRPAFSPDGSLIAFFQKDKGPIGDIWVIASSGGLARRLTFDAIHGGAPAWTPDGRFVVFPSQRAGSLTLWKVPAAGGQPEPVLISAGEDSDPEISRDGRKLIYINTRNSYIIALTDPATGNTQDLHESRTDLVDPSFSPQGDKILFFGFTEGGDLQLFTIGTRGGSLTQVTRGKGERNVHPHWSADGSAVYFYQIRPTISFRKISIRGGDSSELVSGWEWGTHHGARVDPEGKHIIYEKLDKGNAVATMIRDIETGRETAFTLLLRQSRWAHNGNFIVGTDLASGKWSLADITLCPLDGGSCRKLTRGYFPHWSTDDSRIYFHRVSNLRDGEELWSITRDGRDERHIADLRPLHPIGEFFDVSPTGHVVWVKFNKGRSEMWLSDFSNR